MVKKLFKHEFKYYFRTLGIFFPILPVFALFVRLSNILANKLPDGNFGIYLISYASSSMLSLACSAFGFLITIISIVRFYKNIYSAEGYLTLALPVTASNHITVKLVTYLTLQLAANIVIALSQLIAMTKEEHALFFRSLPESLPDFFSSVSEAGMAGHFIGYVIEIVFISLAASVFSMLLFYTCISVGQAAKKNRILCAIGVYILISLASQIIFIIGMFGFLIAVSFESPLLLAVGYFIERHPAAFVHILLTSIGVIISALSALAYFVTHRFMTKKLNLE